MGLQPNLKLSRKQRCDIITAFRGEYGFLSNFHRTKIKYEGLEYPTLEHAFQAAKSVSTDVRKMFLWPQNNDPSAAKRMGQQIAPLRPGWNELRIQVMRELLAIKFSKPTLRRKLIDTYPKMLIEGNNHNDTYWGAVKAANGSWLGFNKLGMLLTELRERLMQQ